MRPENRPPYIQGIGGDFTSDGQQFANFWAPGDEAEKPILTTEPDVFLWRVSVFGDLLLTVIWGTSQTLELNNVRAPLIATFPGRVSVMARARDPLLGGRGICTLKAATGGEAAAMRVLQAAPGAFPFCATSVTALAASTVNVAGVPVALALGQSLPVFGESCSLTAGSVVVECSP